MRAIPFINDLFKNTLGASRAIEGRFIVCPNMGREINSDDLEQPIKDYVVKPQGKKYPLTLMMPPVSFGYYNDPTGEWRIYNVILFFLKQQFNTSTGQIQSINKSTQTSQHTIVEDWHDMDRCAVNFVRTLSKIQRSKSLVNNSFRIDPSADCKITPVSNIGADKAAGVRLDIQVQVFTGCNDQEDYTDESIAAIQIPVDDSHPEHKI